MLVRIEKKGAGFAGWDVWRRLEVQVTCTLGGGHEYDQHPFYYSFLQLFII